MALANVNNQKRQVLSGLLVNRPVSAIFYGDVYYATDNGLWYIYTPSGWVGESLPGTLGADITALLAQNQTVHLVVHNFVFDADDLVKTAAIAYNGAVKHLHLVVPNFTNAVTATVSLVDASGRILWTGAAKAENASYNLEAATESTWIGDQFVDATMSWVVTLSGVAGGAGGTVVLVPRYYGV